MVVASCPKGDTLIVLGVFNATTGSDRDGYQSCVGPHGSGSRERSSSMLLDFGKSRRLRIAGSWFQRPDLHRWTWYANTGGARKEIDHVLVGGRWRLIQNCRVFRSAEFAGTDHRLLVATLKIRLRSRKLAPSNRVRLDVDRLRDESVAQEYKRDLAESLDEHEESDDPKKLWTDFKTKVQKMSESYLRDTSGTSKSFLSKETLYTIAERRRVRLEGRTGQYRELKLEAVRAVRRDKEAQIRGVCETVESHSCSTDSTFLQRNPDVACL